MKPKPPFLKKAIQKIMQTENYFDAENVLTRKIFDLEEVLDFQTKHDIQIIRGDDYQYMCYINKKVYATALTPISALVLGIHLFKDKEDTRDKEWENEDWVAYKVIMNYLKDENVLTRKFFDFEKTLEFQLKHDIQIIRGDDYQYMCYIDKKVYAESLTPMGALTLGIHLFKNKQK